MRKSSISFVYFKSPFSDLSMKLFVCCENIWSKLWIEGIQTADLWCPICLSSIHLSLFLSLPLSLFSLFVILSASRFLIDSLSQSWLCSFHSPNVLKKHVVVSLSLVLTYIEVVSLKSAESWKEKSWAVRTSSNRLLPACLLAWRFANFKQTEANKKNG